MGARGSETPPTALPPAEEGERRHWPRPPAGRAQGAAPPLPKVGAGPRCPPAFCPARGTLLPKLPTVLDSAPCPPPPLSQVLGNLVIKLIQPHGLHGPSLIEKPTGQDAVLPREAGRVACGPDFWLRSPVPRVGRSLLQSPWWCEPCFSHRESGCQVLPPGDKLTHRKASLKAAALSPWQRAPPLPGCREASDMVPWLQLLDMRLSPGPPCNPRWAHGVNVKT